MKNNNLKNKILVNVKEDIAISNATFRIQEELNLKQKENKLIITIKKIFATIIATITCLICSGAVYAAFGGTIDGVPAFKWIEKKFKQSYYVENDSIKVELESAIFDKDILTLGFKLNLKEDFSKNYDGKIDYWILFNKGELPSSVPYEVLTHQYVEGPYVSYESNDLCINGIIDKYRGGGWPYKFEVVPNKEYIIYETWDLRGDDIGDNPVLTIDNIAVRINEKIINLGGNFDIPINGKQSNENISIISGKDEIINYRKFQNKIEDIILSDNIGIINISTTVNPNENEEKYSYAYEYFFYNFNNIQFSLYDQNKNEINYEKMMRESGYKYTGEITSFIFKKDDNIKEIYIDIIDKNEEYKVGTFKINFESGIFDSIEYENNEENKEVLGLDYEEYPEDIFDTEYEPEKNQIKMRYSLEKNYKDDLNVLGQFIYIPFDGYEKAISSNYNNYSFDLETDKDRFNNYVYNKCLEKMNFKIAAFSVDFLYADYLNDNIIDNKNIVEKMEYQYKQMIRIIKNRDFIDEEEEMLANQCDEIIESDNGFYIYTGKILIMNGKNSSFEDYRDNARIKKVKVTINNEKEYIFDLKDTNRAQVFDLDYTQNRVDEPIDATLEVLEIYPGEKTNDIYTSGIDFSVEYNYAWGY